jgi:hypothetical protein
MNKIFNKPINYESFGEIFIDFGVNTREQILEKIYSFMKYKALRIIITIILSIWFALGDVIFNITIANIFFVVIIVFSLILDYFSDIYTCFSFYLSFNKYNVEQPECLELQQSIVKLLLINMISMIMITNLFSFFMVFNLKI